MPRVTVCELDAEGSGLEEQWEQLASHCRAAGTELVLLPEMPFAPWLAQTDTVDASAWDDAVAAHERWLGRLGELGAAVVATTRPVVDPDSRRFNEAVVWTADGEAAASHRKCYLPDEPGFFEARWYERGPTEFKAVATPLGTIGFLICTELWFLQHARGYGGQDADMLLVPRATPTASRERWLAAGRVAGVCAGAFSLSSNRAGRAGGVQFAGAGWVSDPEGELVARTSPAVPFVTVEIDLGAARAAKATYPRYVDDRPV